MTRTSHNGHVKAIPVRTAVVGLGYWGPNLVRNLYELPEAELACVCDTRPEVLEKLSRRFPGIAQRHDFADVLNDETVEAVVLATPVGTHAELAAAALEAGKHVFVEKPLAASLHDARALVELSEANERQLMVGHTFLYSPSVNLIRRLIDDGSVGDIYFISMSRVNLGIHQPDVSVVWDLGPHDFSILRHWLGESPRWVSAVSRGCVIPENPDVAFINLEFGSGAIAHVELAWLAPSKLRRTTIVGSRQMIVYDDTSLEPVRVFDSGVSLSDPASFGEYKLSYRTGDVLSPRVAAAEPLLLEMQDFCRAVRGQSEPCSTARLGLDVVRMVDAVDRSLALDGARVAVDSDVVAVP